MNSPSLVKNNSFKLCSRLFSIKKQKQVK